MELTEKDIMLMLTHGALSGLAAQGNILSASDIANKSVDVAVLALDRLKELGYQWAPAPASAAIEAA